MRPLRAIKNLSLEVSCRQKYQTMTGVEKGSRERFINCPFSNPEMNGCEMKLFGSRFKANKRKSFFTQCVIKLGSLLAPSILEAKGIKGFKKQLDEFKAQQGLLALGFRCSLQPGNLSQVDGWSAAGRLSGKEASPYVHTFLYIAPAFPMSATVKNKVWG